MKKGIFTMDRAVLKLAAKEQIKGNIGTLLIAYLICALIGGALSSIPAVGAILGFIASSVLSFGVLLIIYDLTVGEKPQISRMFDSVKVYNALNIVLTYFISAVFSALWSLLFIVPGIIKAISYSMAPFILIENPDIQPMDAINESKRLMEGHKADYFVLVLSFIPWYLLCLITAGIAAIYVMPYFETTIFNFYYSVKNDEYVQI